MVLVISTFIYLLSFFIIKKEAKFWTILVLVPMLLLSIFRYSVPLIEKYKLLSLWDVLLPVVFFLIVSFSNPNELFYNIFRLIPGTLFFVSMACLSKIIFKHNR
jgi:hypothetical protein